MLEDKFEFFYKPKTRQEIIGNKEIVPASKNELAEKIRSLEESQVIIMDYTIDDKSQKLIGERYHSPENFLKHGDFLVIDSTDSMWKKRAAKFSELKAKKDADKNYFAEYAGITWKRKGVDERSRIVHLTDCVEGVMIYYYLVNSENFSEIFKYSHEAKPSRREPPTCTPRPRCPW